MPISSKLYNNNKTKKGLYLVPTPIGNMDDITLRAIDILKKSDYILCEDTRVSKILLNKYAIQSRLLTNHKFNEKKNLLKFLDILNKGSLVSLICDAGTPTISDPGNILINECIKNKINVIPLPGASSVSLAASISGFVGKFFFYGFFPENKGTIAKDMSVLSNLDTSIIFFISSKKFKKIIPFLKKYFPNRQIVICKEMTKYFEQYIRAEVNNIDETNFELKGELTLVLSEKKIKENSSHFLSESDKYMINKMINKFTTKEISEIISKNTKISKKEVYNYCLKIKNEK